MFKTSRNLNLMTVTVFMCFGLVHISKRMF